MSLLEPMTIPTRGASTSTPSNSDSNSVRVSGGAGCSVMAARSCHAFHGAEGDVASQLAPVETDHLGRSIRGIPGGTGPFAERRDVEHPAARGDDRAVSAPRRAGMGDLDPLRHLVESLDDIPVGRRSG